MTLGSFTNMFKIHTRTHKVHHKYAFLLVEMGPGNILNVTLYISITFSLAHCGWCTQQEAGGKQEIISL